MSIETDSEETPIAANGDFDEIDRVETGVRALMTFLFYIAMRLTGALLFAVVLFQLGYALVTGREAGDEVKHFANRLLTYIVTVARYITYQDEDAPFPFQSFPEELDLTRPRAEESR